ncbi:DNA gyrase C-terminal beta-propeller domain-containing protein, partial [Thermosynechococcus sp. OHK43]
QTNKAALMEKIAELVNEKKIEGIADLRDESDRDGIRVVIELKRDAYPRVVLNNLYKQTPLQVNFGANMLAIVNGEPQLLTLKRSLEVFLRFREEAIARRTRYALRKAEERDHLLQGLLVALANLDAVIQLIRSASDTALARQQLMQTYALSEAQADAILQMQLRRLTALEAEKIEREHAELQRQIADYRDILAHRQRVLEIIEKEVTELKAKYATPRRSRIVQADGEISDTDLIANDKSVILVTQQGYIKRMPVDTFEAQSRDGRGRKGAEIKEDDAVEHFFSCNDHDRILFFSDRGLVYALPAYQIPSGSRQARGTPIVQLLPIPREEKITSVIAVQEFSEDEYLVMLTRKGFIKKTPLAAFSNIRANGLIAISLEEGDQLRWVRRTREEDTIIIGSRQGMAIHFRASHDQLRPLGRATRGVKSMSLRPGDELVGMDILPAAIANRFAATPEDDRAESEDAEETVVHSEGPWVLVITTNGYGKRVPVQQFRLQNRAGMGITATKFKAKSNEDQLAALRIVNAEDELMIVTSRGIIIRQKVMDISSQSRSATGVRLQRLDEEDAIVTAAVLPPGSMEAAAD